MKLRIELTKVFDDGELPVILGGNYKAKYKVGDTIDFLNSIKDDGVVEKLRVIGILDNNNYIFLGGISYEKRSSDNAILIPFDESILQRDMKNESNVFMARFLPAELYHLAML